jgi:hypothetical protein
MFKRSSSGDLLNQSRILDAKGDLVGDSGHEGVLPLRETDALEEQYTQKRLAVAER